MISGLLAGLGGLINAAYLGASDPNAATGLEPAIAAAVIGGTSLMGGRGSIIGAFIGVLIISVLQNGLAQLGVSEPFKRLITGLVIILAVFLDRWRGRTRAITTEPNCFKLRMPSSLKNSCNLLIAVVYGIVPYLGVARSAQDRLG